MKGSLKKVVRFSSPVWSQLIFLFFVTCFYQPIIMSRNKFLLNHAPTSAEVKVTSAENHIKLPVNELASDLRKILFSESRNIL